MLVFTLEFSAIKRAENQLFFIYFSLFLLVFMILIFLEFCDILSMSALVLKGTTATINKYKGYV